jgi:hypothetical protein
MPGIPCSPAAGDSQRAGADPQVGGGERRFERRVEERVVAGVAAGGGERHAEERQTEQQLAKW